VAALKHRAAARLRRLMGVEAVTAQLDATAARLDAIERRLDASRYPHGPVYLGDHEALVVTRWGAKIVVDTRDSLLAPWLLMDGLWEAHVTGWLHDVLGPGQVFVDVGANIGYFTLLGARLVGRAGRVVAVEAHAGLFELLRRNVVMNGHRDVVTLSPRAAWSESARLKFHQRVNYAANSSLGAVATNDLTDLGDSEEVVEVEAAPMDEILAGVERVDVMKVDVEGAEVHAFAGLRRTISANPDITIIFEWSPEQLRQVGSEPAQLVELLTGYGLAFRLLEEDLGAVAGDRLLELPYGNVVAQRP
jgi:FkbM family methyltransferase